MIEMRYGMPNAACRHAFTQFPGGSMRIRLMTVLGLLTPLATISAQQSHGSDMSIGVRFGTLGIGPEISKLVTSHIGLRAGAYFFSLSRTINQSDISFDGKLKMKGITGLLDLYPGARGAFHVTGGVISNPVTITGTGVPSGNTFEINHHTYQSSDVGTLTGTGKWPSASPYVGIGVGTPAASHAALRFVFDLGVAIGKPTVALTATGAASNPQLKADLDAQIATAQTDANKVPVYPAISFGLVVRF
jgi:hypothetical protein